MKKIAFITTNDGHPWGGCDELWYETAIYLKQNSDISVGVSIKKWEPRPSKLNEIVKSGCELNERDPGKKFNPGRSLINRFLPGSLKLSNPVRTFDWLDTYKPDLAIISQGNNVQGLDWMQACFDRSIPYMPIVHLVSEHNWPDDEKRAKLEFLYNNANSSLFVSQENKRLTELMLAADLSNARVIFNPHNVDINANPPFPETSNGFSLAYVGRLAMFHKGIDILVEVLSQRKWKERDLEIVLYGNGENLDTINTLIKKYNLSNLRIGGYEKNIENIWRKHHGLVMSSRIEGMPMVVVEAMFCNRFCIATNVGIVPQLVEDEINGFVSKAANVEFFDEAMERAWQKRDMWKELGQKAGARVRAVVPSDPVGDFAKLLMENII